VTRFPARPLSRLFSRAVSRATRLSGLSLEFRPDELYRVPTEDGAAIALGRYRPRGVPQRFAEPVVLCHGLGTNRFALDFDERHSLARHLARKGFEAWVVELRGRGLSGEPLPSTTFDEQAEFDVRAALRAVLSTGPEQVSWVGHSKGGLLAYAHLARFPQSRVRALVTLGSPVRFDVQRGLRAFVRALGPLLERDVVPLSPAATLAPFGAPPGPVTRALLRQANVAPDVLRRALANLPTDIAGGVARQLARWVEEGAFDANDGFDYRAGLSALQMPVLLVAGARDVLAPPPAVLAARERLGGPTSVLVAGKAHGFSEDYGHGDLLLGRNAPEEVFPAIETFLSRHSTRL